MKDFRGRSFSPQGKLVTVAVASYNNASFITSTLDSIYNQYYAPIQLKIIDDASTDNSVAVINGWIKNKNVRVEFKINHQNQGVCRVCNEFIKQLGDYFVLIGSDDEMEPDRIWRQVQYFETRSMEYGLVYSDVATINEKGSLIEPSWFESKGLRPLEGDLFEVFLRDEFRFPSPSVIYRSSIFTTIGNYDERLKTEDIDMILRILRHHKAGYCPIVAVRYRVLAKSLSRNVGVRFFRDRVTIYRKFLGSSKSVDDYITKKITEWAQRSYYSDDAESKCLLYESIKARFTVKSFLLCLFAWCGIRPTHLVKLVQFKSKIKSALVLR